MDDVTKCEVRVLSDPILNKMNVKALAILYWLFWAGTIAASPIKCEVNDGWEVIITMKTPHPEHALVYRPDGEVVWLQTSPDYLHRQEADFGRLETWIISPESMGTVWLNGEPMIQPVINGSGRYHLYIADNLETEPENTYFIECYFFVKRR